MMAATLLPDLTLMLQAFVVGVQMGACYDVLRLVRELLPHRHWVVSIEDFLCWIVAFVWMFGFCLAYLSGTVRAFALLCHLLGFLCYRLSVGRVVWWLICPIVRLMGRVIGWLLRPFRSIFLAVLEKCGRIVQNLSKFVKKFLKNGSLHLKCKRQMVYNKNTR